MTLDSLAEFKGHLLQKGSLPRHVAIIMDGNGRWARSRSRPRIWGHRQGAKSVQKIVQFAGEVGIEFLTLYAFSEENWGRPEEEVQAIMGLLDRYIVKEQENLHRNNVRFKTVGCVEKLSPKSQQLLRNAKKYLEQNTGLTLTIALSYGGRTEISSACRKIADKVAKGLLAPQDITQDLFSEHLDTADLPDPDLLIRTSGEQRVSNFLLWQIAYAEMWFTDTHWPDFSERDFLEAIKFYQSRNRRFGKTPDLNQPHFQRSSPQIFPPQWPIGVNA